MSTTFRRYAPDQSLLLPPDVREWLPEGHLAHHVSDLVDGLEDRHSGTRPVGPSVGALAGPGRVPRIRLQAARHAVYICSSLQLSR